MTFTNSPISVAEHVLSSVLARKLCTLSESCVLTCRHFEAFIRHSDRCGFVSAYLPIFVDLCQNADEKLFNHECSPVTSTLVYSNVHTTSPSPLELVISRTRATFYIRPSTSVLVLFIILMFTFHYTLYSLRFVSRFNKRRLYCIVLYCIVLYWPLPLYDFQCQE